MSDDLFRETMQRLLDDNKVPYVRVVLFYPADFTMDAYYLSKFDNGITLEAIIDYPIFKVLIFSSPRLKPEA
jgi:hypothetical protein